MSVINNDGVSSTPIIMREEPPNCLDCGKPLRFSFELENGNLCSNCGPGSLRFAEKQTASFRSRARKEEVRRRKEATTPTASANPVATKIEEDEDEVSMSAEEYINKLRIAGSDLCLKVHMVLSDHAQFKEGAVSAEQIETNIQLLFESVKEFQPLTS